MTFITEIRITNGQIEVKTVDVEFIPGGQAFVSDQSEWVKVEVKSE